jgi:hypothetical protein
MGMNQKKKKGMKQIDDKKSTNKNVHIEGKR